MVASECFPLIKTGGLADVVGALPHALQNEGLDVTTCLPGFSSVLDGLKAKRTLAKLPDGPHGSSRLISGQTGTGLSVIALDAPTLFDFAGNPYLNADGSDRDANGTTYAYFSKIAAQLAAGHYRRKRFDLVHAHDWQAGLVPAYLKAMGEDGVSTVLTIHNLAFQGLFPAGLLGDLDLPIDYFHRDGLEYWDQLSYLKGGIVYADRVTTVSPTYALEIQSDEGGMGLGGLLRARGSDLSGILNGIDISVWDPSHDPAIAAAYSSASPAGKSVCKAALQKEMGLRADPDTPLFCVISRLTTQKGLDVLAQLIDHIVLSGGQLALLGSGDTAIEDAFKDGAIRHPTEVAVTIGYDEPLAHRLQAGADAIFIPSRFEPCGLTQLCAMRYGTVPVASRVGGLNDTIIDASPAALSKGCATGILFDDVTSHRLAAAIDRTFALYDTPDVWTTMRDNALAHPVDWGPSARQYRKLYEGLVTPR